MDKRAASINTEEANRPKLEGLSLSTPGTASPRPFDAGLVCLCTPAPKVPRPRNAFILYRQHHQAQVVQHNPGLANPEISKIIGEQWRDEPEDRKNQWKLLAEEEKQRHQRQYPDYRYQPRRGTKNGVGSTRPGAPRRGPQPLPQVRRPLHCDSTHPIHALHDAHRRPPTRRQPLRPTSNTASGPPRTPVRPHPRQQPLHWGGGPPSIYDIHESDYDSTMSPNEAKRRRYNTPDSNAYTETPRYAGGKQEWGRD
ncbi:slightly ste11-like protein [Collariella sp. IMI 366227]|nr:slightly ste11-like protein [Collariella sp. IMI 366227]